jgi:hypothetical protein
MKSESWTEMSLTIVNVNGILFVQSYTGRWDHGTQICTYSFRPRSYPLKMHDGVSPPAEGNTLGSSRFQRDLSQTPSTRYRYIAWFSTDERPEYTENCPGESPVTHPMALSGYPWLSIAGDAPFHFDPETEVWTDSRTIDNSIPGVLKVKTTYDWTLTKTY